MCSDEIVIKIFINTCLCEFSYLLSIASYFVLSIRYIRIECVSMKFNFFKLSKI